MLKNLLHIALFALMSLASESVIACQEYDWDAGNNTAAWTTASNWGPTAGTQGLSQSQVYNVGAPSTWDNAIAPVMSANNTYDVDGMQIFEGGSLSITNGSMDVTEDLFLYDNGDLTISGGSLSVEDVYMIDAGSSITVSGGTLTVSGSIYLGLDSPDNSEDNTSGTPTLTITDGFVECNRLRFDNEVGDTPEVIVSGGELEVGLSIQSDGAPVDITLSGGIIDLQGDFDADNASSSLNISGGDFFITGDWNMDGTVTSTGGELYFNGSATQSIDNANDVAFDSIYFDNSNGFSVSGQSITVRDTIAFADGIFSNTASSVVVLADNIALSGGGVTNHVNGYLAKAGDDAFTFPLGDAVSLNTIEISAPSSATDTFTAAYFNTDPDGSFSSSNLGTGLNNVSRREYWILDRSGSSSVTVTLNWDASSGPIGNLSDLRVARWDNGSMQWEDEGNGGTSGNATTGSIVSNGAVANFSPFTLGSSSWSNPLPVLWLAVDLEEKDETNLLTWSTAAEINSSHFEIERSIDGQLYEQIGTVQSQSVGGYSSSQLNYKLEDGEPLAGTSYYRIKQVDLDGAFEYSTVLASSRVVEQINSGQTKLTIYQAQSGINAVATTDLGQTEMYVYTISGQRVHASSLTILNGTTNLSMPSELSSGIYIFRFVDSVTGESVLTKKMLLLQP